MTTAAIPIGEVLGLLKDEFVDISVSKIRFLESEGLIAPERTASGYRKFTETDVDRLRTVLRLQRDSFLPLRVIRDRLAAGENPEDIAPTAGAATPAADGAGRGTAETAARAADRPREDDPLAAPPDVKLTLSDLAATAGVTLQQAEALREFGVICPHGRDGLITFDGSDLAVTKIAREFLARGIEPRHLKTLRRIAEQEADIFGALVTASLRNPRPEVREQAAVTLREIACLARDLRQAYVGQSLRSVLDGDA